jgi:sugar transferase (PEP-CTERM/EpsH1 system associated)
MPNKVLYLITELSMGGAQQALLHLLCGLNRERFNPTVACLYNGDSGLAEEIRSMGIPIFDARMQDKSDLRALYQLFKHISSQHPTILHTSLFHANLPGRVIGRFTGVPIIINSERTMAMESEWRYWFNRSTINLVDRVIAVSQNVAEFCISHIGIPAEKVVVIHNGVELSSFLPNARDQARIKLKLPQDEYVIGAVSRLDPVKGIDDLIIAFTNLIRTHPAYLVIIGEGPERQRLETVAQETGCADWVIWTGYRADVPELLSAFDVFVQPSHFEGLPNTVLEAMAAALPVVGTEVGGTPELVIAGQTGRLVPPGDPDTLAGVIKVLLENPEERSSMGLAGRDRVQLHFSTKQMVQKTEQLYDELLNEKSIQ